jgi:hypothetical protein
MLRRLERNSLASIAAKAKELAGVEMMYTQVRAPEGISTRSYMLSTSETPTSSYHKLSGNGVGRI